MDLFESQIYQFAGIVLIVLTAYALFTLKTKILASHKRKEAFEAMKLFEPQLQHALERSRELSKSIYASSFSADYERAVAAVNLEVAKLEAKAAKQTQNEERFWQPATEALSTWMNIIHGVESLKKSLDRAYENFRINSYFSPRQEAPCSGGGCSESCSGSCSGGCSGSCGGGG